MSAPAFRWAFNDVPRLGTVPQPAILQIGNRFQMLGCAGGLRRAPNVVLHRWIDARRVSSLAAARRARTVQIDESMRSSTCASCAS
jgi:hypothetical protein